MVAYAAGGADSLSTTSGAAQSLEADLVDRQIKVDPIFTSGVGFDTGEKLNPQANPNDRVAAVAD